MGRLMGCPAIFWRILTYLAVLNSSARVVKLVDTADLKSARLHRENALPDVVFDGTRATD